MNLVGLTTQQRSILDLDGSWLEADRTGSARVRESVRRTSCGDDWMRRKKSRVRP